MEPILARCGYRCDLCLAYKPNVDEQPSNQQKLSNGWHKYFGFLIPADEIYCDGCMAENPNLIDKNCPVRPCVMDKGLENCSQCESYLCEKLEQRLVVYEQIKQKFEGEIQPDDYRCFIKPYENKRRLQALRA